jgi:hypothetical protein
MIDTRAVAQEIQEQLLAAAHRGQDLVRRGRHAAATAIKAGNELTKAVRPALPASARVQSLTALTSPAKLKASAQELADQVAATQRTIADKAAELTGPIAEQLAASQRNLADRARQLAGPVAEQVLATQRDLAGKAVHAASPLVADGVSRLSEAVSRLNGMRKSLHASVTPATETIAVEPVITEPAAAEAVVPEVAAAEAVVPEVVAADPVSEQRAKTRAPRAGTAKTGAAKTSAAKTSAAKTAAAKTSAAKTSAAKAGTAKAGTGKTSAARTSTPGGGAAKAKQAPATRSAKK